MTKTLIPNILAASALIAVALGATLARQQGLIDADTVTRLVMGGAGLLLAWYGNRAPKAFVPDARARQAARVAGWSMALSGLAYAGLWAFAPLDVAFVVGCATIIGGMALTVGYCLSLRRRAPAA